MGQLKYYNGTSWVAVDQTAGDYATLALNEALTGTINGTNKVFTTTRNFTSIAVYRNGIRLFPGSGNDYTVTGLNQITLVNAPTTTDTTLLTADYSTTSSYSVNGTNSFINNDTPTGTQNGTNKVFTVSQAYIGGSLQVYINGMRQQLTTHFTETSSTTFTLSDAPISTDVITASYYKAGLASGNADTVDGYHANATATANTIPVLDGSAKLAGTTISNTVQTQTNAGSAGGTINYSNIGGIKRAWGLTSLITIATGGDSSVLVITLPTSFFTSVTGINTTAFGNNIAWGTQVIASVNSYSASSVSLQLHNFGGGTTGSVGVFYEIIGA